MTKKVCKCSKNSLLYYGLNIIWWRHNQMHVFHIPENKKPKKRWFEGFGAITFSEETYLQKLHFWEQKLYFWFESLFYSLWGSPKSLELIQHSETNYKQSSKNTKKTVFFHQRFWAITFSQSMLLLNVNFDTFGYLLKISVFRRKLILKFENQIELMMIIIWNFAGL